MTALLRPAAVAGVALSLLLAGGVSAAPKAACNNVKDDVGDAEIVTPQEGLDVKTADLGSDGKNITGVIRLEGPPGGANPEAVGGTRYYFEFSAPGAEKVQYLYASVPFVGAPTYRTGEITPQGATNSYSSDTTPVTGSIKGNELTISAPLSAFSGRAKVAPGSKLTGLKVETFAVIGVLLTPVDEAFGKSYVAGSKSCVTPGKV